MRQSASDRLCAVDAWPCRSTREAARKFPTTAGRITGTHRSVCNVFASNRHKLQHGEPPLTNHITMTGVCSRATCFRQDTELSGQAASVTGIDVAAAVQREMCASALRHALTCALQDRDTASAQPRLLRCSARTLCRPRAGAALHWHQPSSTAWGAHPGLGVEARRGWCVETKLSHAET